ncbi:putative phosphosugar-binding protein [Paenibacillus rhizosphaerae]|uniref:Putative phosphosugar-binding protein n=1 Tax=Paenibacillus rhizosphaerae TaxID=297318 RepID=A0A839TSK8_9BACL|nr:sugar isomerase domain-containing protein [Paenibacillus rhizosphaerae]MBB3128358.1 putative phosphosugar-binding protein [Paenibacillus rhizosphaerae]
MRGQYFQKLNSLIAQIEQTQGEAMGEAAQAIASAMAAGKCVHLFDTGHMLDSELVNRAGGLTAFRAMRFQFDVNNEVREREEEKEKDRSLEGLMEYVLRASRLLPGDVLIVGSVSGKTVFPVDIALHAKQMGAYVIALTSVTYSSLLKSEHSSGKRLFEVADLVIDNCAPPLDAMLEVPELNASICPASGIAAASIMWAIEAEVVELLLRQNLKPSVLKSINFPGSAEYNETAYQAYAETSC